MGAITVRDPIHGDIWLPEPLHQVLQAAELQRLRGIKQLGTAYLIYPGCQHTRFEHSLGTVAMATRILDSLSRNGYPVTESDAVIVLALALVHDVSHIPFGHTFEDERHVFPRHDKPERLQPFFMGTHLQQLLLQFGLYEEVWERLSGMTVDWRTDVVASALDADLLDYLRRDAYFAGLSQQYDDRIFRYFVIESGRLALNLTRRGLDRADARSELVHLLRMRYFLTERVYFHHAKVAAGAMVSKAVELAARAGLTLTRLYSENDWSLLGLLAGGEQNGFTPAVASLSQRLLKRQLYKRALVASRATLSHRDQRNLIERFHGDVHQRERTETVIAHQAGVPPETVIIYCPPASAFKETAVLARTRQGVGLLNELSGDLGMDLVDLERHYANLWRFYVFSASEVTERVAQAASRVLGISSELDDPRSG